MGFQALFKFVVFHCQSITVVYWMTLLPTKQRKHPTSSQYDRTQSAMSAS